MLKIKLFIIGLLGATMLMTSCDEDSTGGLGGGNVNAPSVSIFDDGTGTTQTEFTDNTVEPGQVFRIAIEAFPIEAQLRDVGLQLDSRSLRAQQDSNDPALTDEFDNLNVADGEEQNPQLLFGADKDGLTWTFEFVAPTEESTYTYDFVVTDDAGLESIVTLNVSVLQTLPDVEPTITYTGAPTITSDAGILNGFIIDAVMGTNAFESVSVWEDGELVDPTRLRFLDSDPVAEFAFNPLPLFSPDTEGFSGNIFIRSIAGNHDYIIRVTDTDGNNADANVRVEESIVATPLQNTFTMRLLSNASGPDNGALDLDEGIAVPSASGAAEIRDLGIDTNQPAGSNWIQRVEPVNGTDLRVVDLGMLPDGFTFDDVNSKELVAAAFNTGSPSDPTPVLQVGDILAASSPTNIYIMRVDEVNVTDSDNNDNYVFSIKF